MQAKLSESGLLHMLPIVLLLILMALDNALVLAVGSALLLCAMLLFGARKETRMVRGGVALIAAIVAFVVAFVVSTW